MASAKSRYTPFFSGPDAAAGVDGPLGGPRRDVAGRQVAEARVQPLEVVVALVLGDLVAAAASSPATFGTHTRPSLRSDSDISVSFDWNVVGLRDARRVDLRVARVGEVGALAVGPPRRGDVARHRVGRQEEGVAVAAGGEHDGVGGVRADLAGQQVAGDDAGAAAVDDDDVDELDAVPQLDVAEADLAGHLLVGADAAAAGRSGRGRRTCG